MINISNSNNVANKIQHGRKHYPLCFILCFISFKIEEYLAAWFFLTVLLSSWYKDEWTQDQVRETSVKSMWQVLQWELWKNEVCVAKARFNEQYQRAIGEKTSKFGDKPGNNYTNQWQHFCELRICTTSVLLIRCKTQFDIIHWSEKRYRQMWTKRKSTVGKKCTKHKATINIHVQMAYDRTYYSHLPLRQHSWSITWSWI